MRDFSEWRAWTREEIDGGFVIGSLVLAVYGNPGDVDQSITLHSSNGTGVTAVGVPQTMVEDDDGNEQESPDHAVPFAVYEAAFAHFRRVLGEEGKVG